MCFGSARVARRAWPDQCGRSGYGLPQLAKLLSLSFTAHVAVEDARTAGAVLVRAIRDTGLDIESWLKRVESPVFGSDAISSFAQQGDPDGPLAGETIAFTGALRLTRAEAAALAARVGCDVRDGVTKATTILVVGDQDATRLAGHQKSSKHRKAEALILAGQPIRIVGESDFERLIRVA